MEKNQFESLVEKYKSDLMNLGKNLGNNTIMNNQQQNHLPFDQSIDISNNEDNEDEINEQKNFESQFNNHYSNTQNRGISNIQNEPQNQANYDYNNFNPQNLDSYLIQNNNSTSSNLYNNSRNQYSNLFPAALQEERQGQANYFPNQTNNQPSNENRPNSQTQPIYINPNSLTTTESESTEDSYQDFLNKNTETGYLKIQAYTARQTIPIKDVNIIISKKFSDGNKIFYENIKTDESGIIDDLALPAPNRMLSMDPNGASPFETYDVVATVPNFYKETFLKVPIFPGIKSIQPIRLIPDGSNLNN